MKIKILYVECFEECLANSKCYERVVISRGCISIIIIIINNLTL